MGQEEGYADSQHHRHSEKHLSVQLSAHEQPNGQQSHHQKRRRQDAKSGQKLFVHLHAVGDKLKDRRGVKGQAGILPHLIEIYLQNIPQRLSQQEGGQDRAHISHRE